jgi:hypothetical protein
VRQSIAYRWDSPARIKKDSTNVAKPLIGGWREAQVSTAPPMVRE